LGVLQEVVKKDREYIDVINRSESYTILREENEFYKKLKANTFDMVRINQKDLLDGEIDSIRKEIVKQAEKLKQL
jgi:hypothetical protein